MKLYSLNSTRRLLGGALVFCFGAKATDPDSDPE